MDRLNRRKFLRAASGLFVPALMLRSKADTILSGPVMRTMAGSTSLNTNLACYWKMDESSTGSGAVTRVDSVGGQDLTDGSPFAASNTGLISNAVDLVGTNQEYLTHADSDTLTMGAFDFTFAAWVYLSSKASNRTIVGKWQSGSSQREYLLRYTQTSDKYGFFVSNNGTATVSVEASNFGSPGTSTWHLVVAWHVNGVEIGIQVMNSGSANTTSHTTGVHVGSSAFDIGRQQSGVDYFYGRIDEVGLWKNRALTLSDRQTLYNSGTGLTYPFA